MKTYEGNLQLFQVWHAWRTKQEQHNGMDVLKGDVFGIGFGQAEQVPQILLKGKSSLRPVDSARLVVFVVNIPAGKAAGYEKIKLLAKLVSGFFKAHVGQPTTGAQGKKAEVVA